MGDCVPQLASSERRVRCHRTKEHVLTVARRTAREQVLQQFVANILRKRESDLTAPLAAHRDRCLVETEIPLETRIQAKTDRFISERGVARKVPATCLIRPATRSVRRP